MVTLISRNILTLASQVGSPYNVYHCESSGGSETEYLDTSGYCHTAIPPYCRTAIPSHRLTIILSHRHTAIPPYRHTAIPQAIGSHIRMSAISTL